MKNKELRIKDVESRIEYEFPNKACATPLGGDSVINLDKSYIAEAIHRIRIEERIQRDNFSLRDAARQLSSQYDFHGGNVSLAKALRECGVFYKENRSLQKYIDAGYFIEVETTRNKKRVIATLVTFKGLSWLPKRLNLNQKSLSS